MGLTAAERKRRYRARRKAALESPSLVRKAGDLLIPDSALDPYEQAIRQLRLRLVAEHYGSLDRMTVVDQWEVDAALDVEVIREHLARIVLPLARDGRLVNLDQKARRAHPIVDTWLKVDAAAARARERLAAGQAGTREQTLDEIVADIVVRRPQAGPAQTQAVDEHGANQGDQVVMEEQRGDQDRANEQPRGVFKEAERAPHEQPVGAPREQPKPMRPRWWTQGEADAAGLRVKAPEPPGETAEPGQAAADLVIEF